MMQVSHSGITRARFPGVAQEKAAEILVAIRDVTKSYRRGDHEIAVLQGVNLEVPAGAFVALMGPSGSGKTTLLNLIAGLDRPTSGVLSVGDMRISQMSEADLADWRARTVGIVFQSHNLIPVLTAAQNVEIPLLATKLPRASRRERVQTALKIVGLEDRMNHLPRELSGGQEQRVAIARAIVSDPTIIVADEPTGDLDRRSADEVLDLLQELNQQLKKTIFMVTHDPLAAARATVRRVVDKGLLIRE